MKKYILIIFLFAGCGVTESQEEPCEEIPPIILNHDENGHVEFYVYMDGVACLD